MDPATAKMALSLAQSFLKSKTGRKLTIWVGVVLALWGLAATFVPSALLMMVAGTGHNQRTEAVAVGLDELAATACDDPATSPDSGPVASGPVSSQQVSNAKAIDAEVTKLGLSGKATLIALTTAVGESDLVNIGYGDAAGPDSAGLFQQRPSMGWGTKDQVMDPAYATESFLLGRGGNKGLVSVPDWATGNISLVIHQVQGNKDPDHYTSYIPRARLFAQRAGIDLNRAGSTSGPTTGTSSAPSSHATVSTGAPLGVGGCGDQDALLKVPGKADLSANGPCTLGTTRNGTTCNQAIAFAVNEMTHPTPGKWHGMCLHFVALAYGGEFLGPGSAYEAALQVKADGHMHPVPADLRTIPRGAVLWFDGRPRGNAYGHVSIDAGDAETISTDAPNDNGTVGVVPITFVTDTWGEPLMGWSEPRL